MIDATFHSVMTMEVPSAQSGAHASVPEGHKVLADGRSTRWNLHREERRRALARAARKAVHRLGPEASMDEIATSVKTSKSVIYRYFRDKQGLQMAVGEVVVERINAELAAAAAEAHSPRAALSAMVSAYLGMIEHSPNVYAFVTSSPRPLPFMEAVIAILARQYERAQSSGIREASTKLRPEADSQPSFSDVASVARASGTAGFIRGTGDWWLTCHPLDPHRPSRDELAATMTAWLWGGLSAEHRGAEHGSATDTQGSEHG